MIDGVVFSVVAKGGTEATPGRLGTVPFRLLLVSQPAIVPTLKVGWTVQRVQSL